MDASIQTSVETLELVDCETQTASASATECQEPLEAHTPVCDRSTATSPPSSAIPQQFGKRNSANAKKGANISTTASQNKFYELEHGLIGHVIIHKYITTTITTTTTTEKGVQGGRLRLMSDHAHTQAPPSSTIETSTTFVEFNTGPQTPQLREEGHFTSRRVIRVKEKEQELEVAQKKEVDAQDEENIEAKEGKDILIPIEPTATTIQSHDRRKEDEDQPDTDKPQPRSIEEEESLLREEADEEEDRGEKEEDDVAELRSSIVEEMLDMDDMENQIVGKVLPNLDEDPPLTIAGAEDAETTAKKDNRIDNHSLDTETVESLVLLQNDLITKNVKYDMSAGATPTKVVESAASRQRPQRQSTPHHVTAIATTKSVSSQTDEASFIRSNSSASRSRRPRVGHSHITSTTATANTNHAHASTSTSARVCSSQTHAHAHTQSSSRSDSGHTIDIKLEIEKVNLHMRIGRAAFCDNGNGKRQLPPSQLKS